MTPTTELGSEEKRRALDLVLQSRTFHRAEQLKAFLRYVCEAEMEGRGDDLTEYVIGVTVMGRPEGYSPAEDSCVRTRAYELRQKLEKFYATEAPEEPWQIVLPRGSYVPRYVPRRVKPVSQGAAEAERLGPERRGIRAAWIAGLLLAALAGGMLTYLVSSRAGAVPKPSPVLTDAWGPFASPEANVILCVATPLHLTVGPDTHGAFGSPIYPAPPEAYEAFRQHRPLAPGDRLGMVITDNVLGVGTMNAVIATVNMLRSWGAPYQVLPERVAPISALRNRNAFLFGAPVDSDAITKALEKTPLTVDYEPSVREFVIRDRPSGQILVPRKDPNGQFLDVYGLVTVMYTRESDHGRLGTVVFSGITSTGTHGAAEFFSSPRSMRDLLDRFRKEGRRGFPQAYQVVVRCTFSNLLLLTYEYHSHRVFDPAASPFHK